MKALLTSVIFLGLSSALFANVAATPSSLASWTDTPECYAGTTGSGRFAASVDSAYSVSDPNSPYPTMMTKKIPYPE